MKVLIIFLLLDGATSLIVALWIRVNRRENSMGSYWPHSARSGLIKEDRIFYDIRRFMVYRNQFWKNTYASCYKSINHLGSFRILCLMINRQCYELFIFLSIFEFFLTSKITLLLTIELKPIKMQWIIIQTGKTRFYLSYPVWWARVVIAFASPQLYCNSGKFDIYFTFQFIVEFFEQD